MNRNLKNEEVKKYITIGAVLIILYWALQNLQLIFSVMSKILTLFMPFLIGGVIAFIMNVPMKQIERHLFQKEQYQTEKFAALRIPPSCENSIIKCAFSRISFLK